MFQSQEGTGPDALWGFPLFLKKGKERAPAGGGSMQPPEAEIERGSRDGGDEDALLFLPFKSGAGECAHC